MKIRERGMGSVRSSARMSLLTLAAALVLVGTRGSSYADPPTPTPTLRPAGQSPWTNLGVGRSPSVAIDGQTVLVAGTAGATEAGQSGTVYVFSPSPDYSYTGTNEQTRLTSPDAAFDDAFGSAVGLSGDTAVLGSFGDNTDAGADAGSAYVFVRSGGVWSQEAKLEASDASADDYFGMGVAISDDTIVIGASAGWGPDGKAYVFTRSGTTWTQQAILVPTDPEAYLVRGFGQAVAIDGDTIVVGAGTTNGSGAAYVFTRTGTTWTYEAKLTHADPHGGAAFGRAVAIERDVIVCGAYGDWSPMAPGAGLAYVFRRGAGAWTEVAALFASDGFWGQNMGYSVDISGGTVVAGCLAAGGAYAFRETGGVWSDYGKLVPVAAPIPPGYDYFEPRELGYHSVAVLAGTAIVTGYYENTQSHWWSPPFPDARVAYVFSVPYTPPPPPNYPPAIDAGENETILSAQQGDTTLAATASDPDGDSMTYQWFESTPGGDVLLLASAPVVGDICPLELGAVPRLALGDHALRLEVTDGTATSSDTVVVTVDNSPPVAAPTGGGVFEIGPGVNVTLGGQVSDFDGDALTFEWRRGGVPLAAMSVIATPSGGDPANLPGLTLGTQTLGLGVHTVDLGIDDAVNTEVVASIAVEVVDTSAPTMNPVPSTTILWPADHKMVEVTIQTNAIDASGGPVTISVSVMSNKPVAPADSDWEILEVNQATGTIRLNLRAEREGKGDGCTYTVTITGEDSSHNSSSSDVLIKAPHRPEKKK